MDNNLKIIENLTLEKLGENLKSIPEFLSKEDVQTQKRRDSYRRTYPYFLKYFQNIKEIKEDDLVIAAHFIYGWMPTVLTFEFININKVLELLNKAKRDKLLSSSEIIEIKACVNNSLVGVSKLLHFINPHKYAIWDSKIYSYVVGFKKQYGIDNPELYLAYLQKLEEITKQDKFKELYADIKEVIGDKINEVTPMRAIEYVMFHSDSQSKTNQ